MAIEEKLDSSGYYSNRGNSYFYYNNIAKSKCDYEMSLCLDPENIYAYIGLVKVYAELSKDANQKSNKKEAEEFLEKSKLYLKRAFDIDPFNEVLQNIKKSLDKIHA